MGIRDWGQGRIIKRNFYSLCSQCPMPYQINYLFNDFDHLMIKII
ncbi:MAG: hypothetical protein V7K95_23065 [Nostoc sp.]